MKPIIKNGGEARSRREEQGNVLFLILIAVALFAALSYAVTQSSRSGGGDAGQEANLINSSQLIQYPAAVRTSVVRMVIAGISSSELDFMYPSDAEYNDESNVQDRFKVFHPGGGGATYAAANPDVIDSGTGEWVFNGENQIDLIGTTKAVMTSSEADIIAFLPHISEEICRRVNVELGIASKISDAIPTVTGVDYTLNKEYEGGSRGLCDGGCGGTIGTAGGGVDHTLDGQPYGCFEDGASAGTYVYYHVLVER